jgi:coatomer subunit beta'
MFHPKLPIIASASEDGTVRIWQSTTYRPEATLNYGMDRAWALAASPETNKLAIGFDEGCVCIEIGSDDPVASMDSTGKVVWAKNNEIQTTTVKAIASTGEGIPDGERLPTVPRDLGACELYPQLLKHNCNGRFISVCGDGEFIIYTAQALRNKAFGQALDFAWSGSGTGDYAIRESPARVKIFKNFTESSAFQPATPSAEGLFGGHMVGIKGGDEAVLFYDWDSGSFIRKIDVGAKDVFWSEAGNMVLVACADAAYVLSYNAQVTAQALAVGRIDPENGVDGSFELLYEIGDTITSGKWVGDCFIYINNLGRLNYSVGGQIQTLVHLPTNSAGATQHKVLGYLAKEDRVYLIDKSLNIVAYKVMLSVLQYQTAVMRGDFDTANELLGVIPDSEYTKIARFLESQGFKEEALAVTTDPDHKFDLAIELGHIDISLDLMKATPEEEKDSTDTMTKWKKLSDSALKVTNLELCEAASIASNDFPGLLLLYSATGNLEGMEKLAKLATDGGRNNVAFVAYFITGNVEACADLLVATKRLPEAAFFARTYIPSRVDDIVALWKDDLASTSESAANALASPKQNPEKFADMAIALEVEKIFVSQRDGSKLNPVGAHDYMTAKDDLDLNLINLIKQKRGIPIVSEVEVAAEAARVAAAEEAARQQAETEAAAAAAAAKAEAEAASAVATVVTPAPEEESNDFADDW